VKKKTRDSIDAIDADLVWSAACAAYRLNGGYLKEPETIGDQVIRPTNRELVRQALDQDGLITEADRKLAKECRRYMATDVTLKALKTELGEWSRITARVCEQTEIKSNYDLSVITAMPHSYVKALKKESVDSRLARCDETYAGQLGDKVELTVEILRNNYSAKYNTWFVSGITKTNLAVFFAYREQLKSDQTLKIRGTVKRLVDRATQLNRVKVVEEVL
jgi:hypothetical protein